MDEKKLRNRINHEVLEHFYRTCIVELSDVNVDDAKESVPDIFKSSAAVQLDEKALSFGCKNFADLLLPVDDPSVDHTLAKFLRPYFDDCEDFGLPTTAAEMQSLDMLGLLIYPGQIGFIHAGLDIQLWDLSCEELSLVGNPENHIVSFNPLITFDLYGNVNGYSLGGLVCIFEGYGGDWGDPEDWGWS